MRSSSSSTATLVIVTYSPGATPTREIRVMKRPVASNKRTCLDAELSTTKYLFFKGIN